MSMDGQNNKSPPLPMFSLNRAYERAFCNHVAVFQEQIFKWQRFAGMLIKIPRGLHCVEVLGKLAPTQIYPYCKTYMENSRLRKFFREFSDRFFLQNNIQCRYFVATVDIGPISTPWMRWQSQADIDNNKPCQFEVYWNMFGTKCTCGPFAGRYHLNTP